MAPVTHAIASVRALSEATGAENDRLGDQLFRGLVELGVVVLEVGAHERVRQLMK